MFKNSYKFMFFITMIMGTMISISSLSWFSMWMGLEINLLSFIPLMMSSKNLFSSESTLKYFLTQALASSIFLFSIILLFLIFNFQNNFTYFYTLISSSLLLKCGAAPFHFWFPSVAEGLNWKSIMILMTWQKIAPLFILSYCLNFFLLMMIVIMSIFFGSLGGLNQTSLRKLMAFSSINHLGWMLSGLMMSENLLIIYFIFYSFLSLTVIFMFNNFKILNINQTFSLFNSNQMMKIYLFILLFSLGGLPPFLGFFPKWMIIESLILLNLFFLLIFMLFFTLITLFFYLRICYAALLMNHKNMNWNFKIYFQKKSFKILTFFSLISILGFSLINLFFFLF